MTEVELNDYLYKNHRPLWLAINHHRTHKNQPMDFKGYPYLKAIFLDKSKDQSIIQLFGSRATMTKTIGSQSYVFLKKNDEGCIFLYNVGNKRFCSIHESKPTLCRLWPFIVCDKPKYGKLDEAVFYHYGEKVYVYVEPHCPSLVWGKPENRLKQTILPEIIDFKFRLKNNRLIHTN